MFLRNLRIAIVIINAFILTNGKLIPCIRHLKTEICTETRCTFKYENHYSVDTVEGKKVCFFESR